jgi:hypothetical protein
VTVFLATSYCVHSTCQCRKAPKGLVEKSAVHFGACIFFLRMWRMLQSPTSFTRNDFATVWTGLGHFVGMSSWQLPLGLLFQYSCPHANSNWIKYILAAYFPLTLFYFVIVFLKINIVSIQLSQCCGSLQSRNVTDSHQSSIPTSWKKWLWKFCSHLSLYGVWNLDFFRQICVLE